MIKSLAIAEEEINNNRKSKYLIFLERVERIELSIQPWQGRVLPLALYPHKPYRNTLLLALL